MLIIEGVIVLPEMSRFLAFTAAGLALSLIPGADMTFIASASVRAGVRGGISAVLGISTGTLLHIAAAAVGLSALIASSETGFTLLKWAGAVYLFYIAFDMLRSRPDELKAHQPNALDAKALFRSAMLVNLLNAKVIIFFVAFLPQFIDPETAFPAVQILSLGLWLIVISLIVDAVVVFAAARSAQGLRQTRWIARLARWSAATVMGAVAVRLAMTDR